jgi:chromosome segregation ATPase
MNNKNIFSILLVIAFVGILAQSQFNFGPKYDTLILVAAGFTPLILYRYYLGSRDTLTQTEIDSIYYFGFLVTLIVLGATALRLVFFSAQIESVAAQFGLGLLATGFGLWSRLTLLTKNVTTDASDELLQRQLNHIGQITERFSETVELFKNLRDEAITRSQDAMRATTSAALQKLSDELSQPLNALSLNIIAVTESLGKFDSRTFNNIEINAKALSDSIPDTTESITKLKERVIELDLSLKSPTLELTNFHDKLKSSNVELVGLPGNLSELKSSSNLMKSSLEEATLSLQRFSKIDFSELPSLISGYIKISDEIGRITLQITGSPQLIGTETANFKVTLDNLSKEMKAKSEELNQASKYLTDSLSKMAYSIHNAIDKLPK